MCYKFKVGDKGKTRGGGNDYEVIRILQPSGIVVAVLNPHTGGCEVVGSYFADGHMYESTAHTLDLMPPQRVVYLNIWTSTNGAAIAIGYDTAERATVSAGRRSDGCDYDHIALPFVIPNK